MCLETPTTKLQLDHQKSLALGGHNVARNVAALCAKCNMSKGDDHWDFGSIEHPIRGGKLIQKGHLAAFHISLPRTIKARKARKQLVGITVTQIEREETTWDAEELLG